jgi:ABC-type sugar transport system ATPase subunit
MTVSENINIGNFRSVSRFQVLDRGAISSRTVEYGKRLQIRCDNWDTSVGRLSGGNQQKVLISRLLAMKPKVLILDEPTRGIDVAAKSEIHRLLFQLADSGLAIIVISSESEEVLSVSDRICVFYKGQVTRLFSNSGVSSELLLRAAMGD